MNKNEILKELSLYRNNKSYFNYFYNLLKKEIVEQENINEDIDTNYYLFNLKQTLEKQANDFQLNGTNKNYKDFIEDFMQDVVHKIESELL